MPGLIRGVARTAVIAGTATTVSNRVSRRQRGRWAQQDAEQAAVDPAPQTAPPAVPQPAPPADDMTSQLTQLKELGELKASGVLTDAEFEEQKRKILGT